MQHRLVWPITDTSEKIALFRAGVSQHGQRLIRMRRDNHAIVTRVLAAIVDDGHARRIAQDRLHAATHPNAIRIARGQLLRIFPRAADNGTPCWPVHQLQQSVIDEKPRKSCHGVRAHVFERGRPDRSRHWEQMKAREGIGIAMLVQIATQRRVRIVRVERVGSLPIKA